VPEANVFLVRSLLADVTLRGTAARVQAALQRPTCTARPAPPTTPSTPGSPASTPAWWRWAGSATTNRAAWASANPAAAWCCRRGSRYMGRALKGVPVVPLVPPAGVEHDGRDWRPAGEAAQGLVLRIAVPDAEAAPAPEAAASSASRP
jgi:penicillin-binding protein 1A